MTFNLSTPDMQINTTTNMQYSWAGRLQVICKQEKEMQWFDKLYLSKFGFPPGGGKQDSARMPHQLTLPDF